ncbi:MAG: alpha/beta fold hydrolase [Nitrospirota bacterium]
MSAIRIGDISMYYEVYGDGEPLLLINGLGLDSSFWMPQVSVFSQKYRVIVFDNRGVGQTDAPEVSYTTDMMADDTIMLLDHLSIARTNILGFSMGGLIAQKIAIKYPERVNSMILASTAAELSPKAKQIISVWRRMLQEKINPETYLRQQFLWVFTDRFLANDEQVSSLVDIFLRHPFAQTLHGFSGQANACLEHNTSNQLQQINIPTLILVGSEDIFIPVHLSKELANGIKNAELIILKDGGHGFCSELAEKFNQTVLNFLD